MTDSTATHLILLLFFLILLSGFFSGSETSITSMNRYKLQHRANQKHKQAMTLLRLMQKPDEILSAILIGNTLSNIIASSIVTLLAIHFGGDIITVAAPFALTLVILIFAEIAPKTVATLYPEKIAYPASTLLRIFLTLLYPLVITTNTISQALLRLCGVQTKKSVFTPLTKEDLRSMLASQSNQKPEYESDMLVGVLNLEQLQVDSVMIPRNDIHGLDISAPWADIMHAIKSSQSEQIIVYKAVIDEAIGFLSLTTVITLLEKGRLNKSTIIRHLTPIAYIPEGTSLKQQLKNFQKEQYNSGIIVNEYGETLGFIRLEDILEEITGKMYQDQHTQELLHEQSDGSYIVSGNYPVRDLNRELTWALPTDGPTTLSGLIIEHLETIPEGTVCCQIGQHRIEVIEYKEHTITTICISKPLITQPHETTDN